MSRYFAAASMIIAIASILWLALAGISPIAATSSIVFTHSKIIIQPAIQPEIIENKPASSPADNGEAAGNDDGNDKKEDNASPPPRQAMELSVNMRPLSSLYREGFYSQRPFKGVDGILFQSDLLTTLQVRRINLYALVDVAGIDEKGVITSLVPNIVPAELARNIELPGYLRALLYLPGGFLEKYGITPGDRVIHPIFSHPPEIIQ